MSWTYTEPQWVGIAFVFMGLVLAGSVLVRRFVPALGALFIPSSVIAGFVILLVGPQVLGAATGVSLVPAQVVEVWRALPGLLINVVFAAVMLGKTLPSLRTMWDRSAGHVILGSAFSFGQFALGSLAVVFLLTPVFGLNPLAGSIIELSFAGGHGTIAGMGDILVEAGAGELVDLGLGLATVSMVTGVVGGSLLVRYAVRNPNIPVARTTAPRATERLDLSDPHVAPADEPTGPTPDRGISAITAAFMLIAVAIAIAMVILETLRWGVGALGSDVFDTFPLFPFTVIGGFVVQTVLTRLGKADLADRTSVQAISGLSLDVLIASAIGTMSLATLGANIPALVVLTVVAVAWSVVGLLWLGPRLHPVDWFEHGIADFGQSQGNVATGFVLADMADPDHRTDAANGYGYKQLTYEPFLGGGLLTAFSVPLLALLGTLTFGLISVAVTAVLIWWGWRRAARVRARVAA